VLTRTNCFTAEDFSCVFTVKEGTDGEECGIEKRMPM